MLGFCVAWAGSFADATGGVAAGLGVSVFGFVAGFAVVLGAGRGWAADFDDVAFTAGACAPALPVAARSAKAATPVRNVFLYLVIPNTPSSHVISRSVTHRRLTRYEGLIKANANRMEKFQRPEGCRLSIP